MKCRYISTREYNRFARWQRSLDEINLRYGLILRQVGKIFL